ncbi:unnamed protein product [Camellia sinensis]
MSNYDKFEIGDDFHNDLQAQQIVNKKAYGLYKDWRYTLKQEFELLEGLPIDEIYAQPPLGVSLDDWKHLIDVAFLETVKRCKSYRSQLSYNHTNGSRAFPITMVAMQKHESWIFLSSMRTATLPRKRMTGFIRNAVSCMAAIESGTPLTHEEVSRQVLGQKKRYLLGFGSGPLPSTIATSRAHDKDMEAMRAKVEALHAERQKDHDELMKE